MFFGLKRSDKVIYNGRFEVQEGKKRKEIALKNLAELTEKAEEARLAKQEAENLQENW